MKKIKVLIDRFEGDSVVFKAESQEFKIPREMIPGDLEEKDAVYLTFSSEQENQEGQEELAKNILNEVLQGND